MKNVWTSLVLMCLIAFPALAQSQQSGFQQGKVISIQVVPATVVINAVGDPTDAPLKASISRYNISVQVDDAVYVYRYLAESGEGVPLEPGQTEQVRIKGKVMQVKLPTGEVEHYSIVRTSEADSES